MQPRAVFIAGWAACALAGPLDQTSDLPPNSLRRRSAVLAVYAAEALLLAFSLKLRVAAALAGQRGPRAATPAAAAALGLDDGSFHRAASFLGQCMPQYVTQPGASRPALKVRRSAAAPAGGLRGAGPATSRRPASDVSSSSSS